MTNIQNLKNLNRIELMGLSDKKIRIERETVPYVKHVNNILPENWNKIKWILDYGILEKYGKKE